ncbi:Iron hydrogenase 1 [bioreactor metagenome]|uniref:Iron hydrogenase 1 n=1 Tax=bioreactor metagenome TaxID=1076179 RepID=A0A645J404_9ZZZZ
MRGLRSAALYKLDENMPIRRSNENPVVQRAYAEYLGEPGGHRAHELLHCTYVAHPKYHFDDQQ